MSKENSFTTAQNNESNMTLDEIIQGLQFTVDMFLLDPNTGETLSEPRNDLDKTTIDSCRGAIKVLQRNEMFVVTSRCGLKMGEPVFFHTEESAKKYAQSEIRDCWKDIVGTTFVDKSAEESVFETAFSYCAELNTYSAYAGGNDLIEFQIIKIDLSKGFEDDGVE